MLTKEAVVGYVGEYLGLNGYEINHLDKSSDIVLKKDGDVLRVVAMGAINDAGSTSKKGKGFNKNQIRTNLGLALYEVSRQMTINGDDTKYIIAIPDSILYEKLSLEIKEGFKVLDVKVILTSEMGLVRELLVYK